MKIEQAKDIVGTINLWQMFVMGIGDQPKEVLDSNLSLSELIEANEKVKKWNKKQMENISSNGGTYQQRMVMADRLIAAVYVAMNYKPNSEVVAVMGGVGIGCVKMDYSE